MPLPDEDRKKLEEELRQGQLDLREGARALRKLMGMTQIGFAQAHDIAPRTYIDFERGVGNPTLETLEKIGAAFGCRLIWVPEKKQRS